MTDEPRADEHGARAGDTPDPGEAADAALNAVEPERLLAGEREDALNKDTLSVADALHWLKVYSELLEFKRSLLAMTEQHISSMVAAASREARETDHTALLAEAQRFERRLAYWRDRAHLLQEKGPRP